jgi:hypothetical protein
VRNIEPAIDKTPLAAKSPHRDSVGKLTGGITLGGICLSVGVGKIPEKDQFPVGRALLDGSGRDFSLALCLNGITFGRADRRGSARSNERVEICEGGGNAYVDSGAGRRG